MPNALAFDEMARTTMLMEPVGDEDEFEPRVCTDVDIGVMQERLQRLGLGGLVATPCIRRPRWPPMNADFTRCAGILKASCGTKRPGYRC